MKITYGPNVGSPDLVLDPPQEQPLPQTRTATWKTVDQTFVRDCYADMGLTPIAPRFIEYPNEVKLALPIDSLPNPRTISTTQHPIVLDLVMQAQRFDPTLAYDFYLRGVAATALIIRSEFYENIRSMLAPISESITSSEPQYPSIDLAFAEMVERCERVIFTNSQHSSWKGLIAFMQGAFWLLSFIAKPKKRRGSYSPMEYVDSLVKHYGERAYIPL